MRNEPRATLAAMASFLIGFTAAACADQPPTSAADPRTAAAFSPAILDSGLQIFRFETFGNETFWTDTAALHDKIAEVVTPVVALGVGLKVDIEALPPALRAQLLGGQVDLNSTASTIALISHDAVVGVNGHVENGQLVRIGVTCALCHSTVDNSTPIPGVGRRLDGWPNRDLNVGAIIALSDNPEIPDFPYNAWGPGMYDPRFNQDGLNIPVVLPPAFGLRHVSKETYTGDGPVSYWNAYVAITQMHGHGFFSDPRINVDISNGPVDLVSDKLPALRAYQLSLDTPEPKPGSFDAAAAKRGEKVFRKEGGCASCHRTAIFSDIKSHRLHDPAEVGQDPSYVMRSATKQLRATPLRGLWNPPQLDGPYFHDGSAPTLEAVVEHYVNHFNLTLSARQKADLVEYLKTL